MTSWVLISTDCGHIDLSVVIDISTAVGSSQDWSSLVAFLKSTVSRLTLNQHGGRVPASLDRVTLVTYADSVTMMTSPQNGDTASKLSWFGNALGAVRVSTRYTRDIASALRSVNQLVSSLCDTKLMNRIVNNTILF